MLYLFTAHLGKPKATLRNSLRRKKFIFGTSEKVRFTCEALSYPFPEKIEFFIQSTPINEHTTGVSEYKQDFVSVKGKPHQATFVVRNISGEFSVE